MQRDEEAGQRLQPEVQLQNREPGQRPQAEVQQQGCGHWLASPPLVALSWVEAAGQLSHPIALRVVAAGQLPHPLVALFLVKAAGQVPCFHGATRRWGSWPAAITKGAIARQGSWPAATSGTSSNHILAVMIAIIPPAPPHCICHISNLTPSFVLPVSRNTAVRHFARECGDTAITKPRHRQSD